jgi:hypothetical protein
MAGGSREFRGAPFEAFSLEGGEMRLRNKKPAPRATEANSQRRRMVGRNFTAASMALKGRGGKPSRLGKVLRKEFPEGGARPKEEAFDGAYRHPEHGGDFFVGKVLVAP